MRRAQKQQILDCMSSLHQAHREIKEALGQKNITVVQNMLSECQDFAVSIGGCIEEFEGEGHIAVTCLEEYCEALFHVFEEVVNGIPDEDAIYKIVEGHLAEAESSVKYGITVKKEVVFLPYKASMWDSLESVYLATRDEKDVMPYVIPIPYFDRNADGSLGKMHYEGNEFPEDIPITSWQEYSIQDNRPDTIYIHNPYDGYNLVTSVHPSFYASELKKYTDKLVYIPYFILREIDPGDQGAIEAIKHFIWTPGVFYADEVVVQSEKMKQIYVNEYLKAARANGMTGCHLDREYLEHKILGLGSPKIEKVRSTKKESLKIPEEWFKVIRKTDGSWKKIIFYNTGIAALLEHNEKWVDKIERVLKVFSEVRGDIALLWRPHPLIENTLRSMRPELLRKYQEIKKRYQEEEWGIYDDTADIDRAVVLCDAYYGDRSSVVVLCQKAGKTIMIQNVLV